MSFLPLTIVIFFPAYRKLIYQHSSIDELVSRIRTLVALKTPSARNFNSFKDWMIDQKPVTRDEMPFIQHPADFVALADGQEGGWFDGFIEDLLSKIPKDLARVGFFFFRFPCYPPMSLLRKVLLYRDSSPVPKNVPNLTTRTCICTQDIALTYLFA